MGSKDDSVHDIADRDSTHERCAIADIDFREAVDRASDAPQRFAPVAARKP
jgi:hypothetical protein